MNPLHRPGFPKVAAAVAVTLALAAVTAFGTAPLRDVPPPLMQFVVDPVTIATQAEPAPGADERPEAFVQSQRIQRGETLASLLDRLGVSDSEFHKFVAANPLARKLLQLQSGRTVTAAIDAAGRIRTLQYRYGSLDPDTAQPGLRLTIRRDDDNRLQAVEEPLALERQVAMGVAEVRSSLFAATDAAGIPESVATQVADILDGEVDFNHDLRRGDTLRVIYELVREADSLDPPTVSRILALQFVNNGARHEAVWFDRESTDEAGAHGGYFRFDGQSLRKAFLRHPLEFSRISSGFSNARVHPIFKYTREHKGVDFAAPTGTKVRSSGDGIVDFVGQQRGYGNMIVVRHRNGISTLYAHLNGFASGLSEGTRVVQGEVIGFVGSTGWATGPHLHYEFIVNGEQVDPISVAMPAATPLDSAERALFQAQTSTLRAQIAQLDGLRLAARFE